METAGDLIIGGSSVAIIIMLVIQLAKSYGMDGRYAPLIAIVLGIGASITVAQDAPPNSWVGWVGVAVRGFTYGLGAIGIHAATNALQHVADEKALKQASSDQQVQITATATATPDTVTKEVEIAPLTQAQQETGHHD